MKANLSAIQPMNRPPTLPRHVAIVAVSWPMISVELAMLLLNENRAGVLELIETGALRYAWNLGRANTYRGFIRIYSASLLEYQKQLPAKEKNHDDVMMTLFPLKRGNPTNTHLCDVWACSSDHPLSLGRAGLLKTQGACHRGRTGSPHFSRTSILSFMEARQLP